MCKVWEFSVIIIQNNDWISNNLKRLNQFWSGTIHKQRLLSGKVRKVLKKRKLHIKKVDSKERKGVINQNKRWPPLWQYGLSSFHGRYTKLERFLAKKQYIHIPKKKLLYGELSKSAKIWLSKSIFYVKNDAKLFIFFLIEEYLFKSTLLLLTFLTTLIIALN